MNSNQSEELTENPRENVNFLSNLFFCFTIPIFSKGRKRDLGPKDLYKALKDHESGQLGDKLSEAWQKEIHKGRKDKENGMILLRAMLTVFGGEISTLGLTVFSLEFCLKITQPLFLGSLVAFYSKNDGNISDAHLYAGAVVMCSAINVLLYHSYMLNQRHCGMKLRVALISMIYRKALRLTTTALGSTTAGQIVNLLSNDVGKMDLSTIFLHYLWLGPLETIVITYFMYQQIGSSAFVGVAFLVLFIPLQAYLGKKTSIIREKTAIRTDERIRFMNEIIKGIQVIKMYTWEKPFGALVARARKREIKMVRFGTYIISIMISFMMFVTRFSIFSGLVTYALLGQMVTAEKAFVITAYCNILRNAMTDFFPKGISTLAETLVSFKRIQRYMLYLETANSKYFPFDGKTVEIKDIKNSSNIHLKNEGITLRLKDVKAKWNAEHSEYTLDGMGFDAKPGELIAIIGPVGAGKSSIFQAILGELPLMSGVIQYQGAISYASQEPWLFGGTIQQNILFGQPMDRKRYDLVIEKCALERDLIFLPGGDQTIVGDRGASLSGGQKARIGLARAVYRHSELYILDDPLSAVDTNVGRHLFNECIRGFLKEQTIVLITHQLQYLQQADKIIIIDHGRISAMGTYDELQSSKENFARLLSGAEDEANDTTKDESTKVEKQRVVKEKKANGVNAGPATKMLVKETQKTGTIGWRLYVKYFKSGGGNVAFFTLLLFCVTAQVLASGSDYFLAYWVNKEKEANLSSTLNIDHPANNILNDTQTTLPPLPAKRDTLDIGIFTSLILGTIIITLSRSFLFFNVAMKASRRLHNAMYNGVVHTALLFYHTNPVGRILNRFSKDMGQVDEQLPAVMIDVIQVSLSLVGVVVVISIVKVWFLIPTVLMILLFYKLRNFYLQTARNVKRMEAVTRSPIFSHLSTSLSGLPTIRAFRAQGALIREFDLHQDAHSSVFFAFLATTRAFGFWLDCICVIYIAIVTLSFFMMGRESGGNIGLAITQALSMTGIVQWGMRQSAELENLMTAVERVIEYETLEQEEPTDDGKRKVPPKGWPQNGHIQFKNLSLKYFDDPDTDCTLKELNFEIMPSEKIGIVGRTGAGKTSMINALFRLAYNDGSIIIDGIDTAELQLNCFRSKISIIPQEPVLFSGTIRYNLDPFDEYSDARIWEVLHEVELKRVIADLPGGLHSKVTEGGSNFSIGQRQLVCLARAILRENNILVMDEATANVDPHTDALIQSTIRQKFNACTVITIAHRLNTVMDSDRILVMDAGRIVEYDAPYILLTEVESKVFLQMAKEMGKSAFNNLLNVAKTTYEAKKKSN